MEKVFTFIPNTKVGREGLPPFSALWPSLRCWHGFRPEKERASTFSPGRRVAWYGLFEGKASAERGLRQAPFLTWVVEDGEGG